MLTSVLVLNVITAVAAAPYPDRLVWVFGWGLRNENEAAEVIDLLETAKQAGLNGAVLSASLDTLCKQRPDYLHHLARIKQASDRLGLELIPSVFSVGYGGGALAHNRQLAEGLPVVDAPFVVKNGQARLDPSPEIRVVNGGFEEHKGQQMVGFNFHDQPGTVSFIDHQVAHSGKASLRLENFTANRHGHGRVMQTIRVRPGRCYRMSVWVRTEDLQPANAFRVTVLSGDRELAPRTFKVPASTDWRKLTLLVNSLDFEAINIYAGVWGGKAGKVWLDDWTFEEVGPINVLRRHGTPVTVRNHDGSFTYAEGKDFALLTDPDFNFYRVDREAPALRLLDGARIREGDRLKVSWFHPMVIHESQVTVCMAEPELYDIYEHEAALLAEHLRPRRVLLNMDEVRMGGTCDRCRGKDMSVLLGECITRQTQILRSAMPGAEVYIWSDMLDPHHNARGNYYLVRGDFTGSWKHVPKDLTIAVWGGTPREKSLRFFSDLGFQTLVACYYDADTLTEVSGWLEAARDLSGVRGFMYTPWLRKYELLPSFGKLLQAETRP